VLWHLEPATLWVANGFLPLSIALHEVAVPFYPFKTKMNH
jgi:hypothetical protein